MLQKERVFIYLCVVGGWVVGENGGEMTDWQGKEELKQDNITATETTLYVFCI